MNFKHRKSKSNRLFTSKRFVSLGRRAVSLVLKKRRIRRHHADVFCDASFDSETGLACSVAMVVIDDRPLRCVKRPFECGSSLDAEIDAMIIGVQAAPEDCHLTIWTDCSEAMHHINKERGVTYRVSPERDLLDLADSRDTHVVIRRVRREDPGIRLVNNVARSVLRGMRRSVSRADDVGPADAVARARHENRAIDRLVALASA